MGRHAQHRRRGESSTRTVGSDGGAGGVSKPWRTRSSLDVSQHTRSGDAPLTLALWTRIVRLSWMKYMRRRTVILAAAMLVLGCGDSTPTTGSEALQNECVANQLGLERTLPDGSECGNVGFTDCGRGFASGCINTCAYDRCQPEPCESAGDCESFFGELPIGLGWECSTFEISERPYGDWCRIVEVCTPGTAGCPCMPGDVCGPDPFGPGDLSCEGGRCTSSCQTSCIVGSVCCGGALCSGGCIGTPCCSGGGVF